MNKSKPVYKPISDAALLELETLSGQFEARKLRAKERLSELAQHSVPAWYFALVGLELEQSEVPFAQVARFAQVVDPPGEIELAAAANDPSVFGAIGRYSSGIRAELVVSYLDKGEQFAFDLAWSIISALRARTCAEFLVVAVADCSWSTIAAIDDRSTKIQLLEDNPLAHRYEPIRLLHCSDIEWSATHLVSFVQLLAVPPFRLAVDSLCSHHKLASNRMAGAMLWSGIEALFCLSSELRFRLAMCVAVTIEPRGAGRIACYRSVKKLYDFRSRLVHGSVQSDDAIQRHVIETRRILSRLICRFSEEGTLFDEDRVEQLLLGL